MGLLDRFFGNSQQDKFAKSFIAALKKAGDPRKAEYDAEHFRLVYTENGQQQGLLNLGNLYAEFQQVEPAEQQQCMSELVRAALSHLKEMPEEYDAASHDIRPRLWARATFEQIRLRSRLTGQSAPDWPLEPIGDHLFLSLVYDLPESVRSISNSDLENWGVTYWEAREVAVQNLEETEFVLASLDDELFASNSGDTYDATRMILPELVQRLPLAGQPILMVPNRDTLLLTGTESEIGQKMMLEFADQQLDEQPRPLVATPLTLDYSNEWVDWQPEREHPLFKEYHKMRLKWFASEYAEQKQLIDEIHEKESVDLFMATYNVAEKSDGTIFSYCVWGKDVESLLPEADYFAVMESPEGPSTLVPFTIVMEKFGNLFIETDYYPKRFHVRDFPTSEEFAALVEEFGV